MKLIIFFTSLFLAVTFAFAGLVAIAITAFVAAGLTVFTSVADVFNDNVPYFDSEDIGREVKPYVKRIGITEILIVAICAALLFTCYLILP